MESNSPMGMTHHPITPAKARDRHAPKVLPRHAAALAASRVSLKGEILRRQVAEKSLLRCQRQQLLVQNESRLMQRQLRHLSHRFLSAQEEDRKEISRELHDEVSQILAGINVHLAGLKVASTLNFTGLKKKVTVTQRLVEKSIRLVHQFARDLRPTALDDLGLIPTLEAYLKDFTKRTGLRVHLDAFAAVEQLAGDKRTVLYRVTQAALVNVAQHAAASFVSVRIKKAAEGVCLEISDNGKSFHAIRVLASATNKRLGILGMRERVEMVGGHFSVESTPSTGTTIHATIPFRWRTGT
jgi:signal transduction histidine kinase